ASLRDSEARINLAANAANFGLWVWNIRDDELLVTEKWRRLFGFAESEPVKFSQLLKIVHPEDRGRMKQTVQEMLEHGGGGDQEMGNGWTEGVHPDDLQRCHQTYTVAFDARAPFVMQYRLRRHDGEYRWLKDEGMPRYDTQKNFTGYIGSCVDITESISKEQALRESEERMSLAMAAAKLGLWEWNVSKDELWGTKARRG